MNLGKDSGKLKLDCCWVGLELPLVLELNRGALGALGALAPEGASVPGKSSSYSYS